MARLIVKWRYIKPGAPKQGEHYVNYIATREGVEIEGEKWKDEPATKEQEKLVNRLIADFPDCKDSFEYQDYLLAKTKYTATTFIDKAIEENVDRIGKKENYIGYIAMRPRVEKSGAHGLFSYEDDGSMYCIPLFESTEVFTYDKDLCESKKLYIAEGSTDEKLIFVKSPAQKKQKGVDGIAGTEDDGLPETYAQLYLWFNAMKSSGVKPMTWSGMFKFHIDNTLQNYWADFEGPENVKRCYTFDGGSDSTLIDTVDENGNITYLPATAITTENGYMVQRQEGRYRALSVAKKIAENANDWVNSTSFLESESHTLSQATYINSRFTESPIMLFAHGSYWEAEATPVFKNYESQKSGKADRHFGVLPIPKYSRSEVGKATTVVSDSSTAMFVKSGLTGGVLDAVKDFVIYFNNQENMGLQNKYSASPRPFTYELSDELKATMTDYEISLYDFYKEGEKKNVVYTAARNDFFMANFDEMHKRQWVFASKYKSNSSTVSEESVVAFKNEPNVTLKQYFDGLYNRFTADDYAVWKTMLRKIG